MSTKCSIAYGDGFHFYQDLMDDNGYTLEIDSCTCCYHDTKITIPYHIWEIIKDSVSVDLSLVNISDEELLTMVESKVDKRIAEYNAFENENSRVWANLAGSAVYGAASDPRDEQIKAGLESLKYEREKQIKINEKINAAVKK